MWRRRQRPLSLQNPIKSKVPMGSSRSAPDHQQQITETQGAPPLQAVSGVLRRRRNAGKRR
eukprot:9890742-Alexandrium_andersonii.AAC.1